MSLVQLFVSTEVAHDTVAELGELENMQFKDVRLGLSNSRYMKLTMSCTAEPQRQSLPTIIHRRDSSHRRDGSSRSFFSTQIEREKDKIPVRPLCDSAPLITVGPRAAQTMDGLDVTFAEHESRLVQMNESYELLSGRLRELVEARHVLRETAVFFDRVNALTKTQGIAS